MAARVTDESPRGAPPVVGQAVRHDLFLDETAPYLEWGGVSKGINIFTCEGTLVKVEQTTRHTNPSKAIKGPTLHEAHSLNAAAPRGAHVGQRPRRARLRLALQEC